MKFLLFFISLFIISSFATGQTIVYKTYNDYRNSTGEKMDSDYIKYEMGGSAVMEFKDLAGNKVKYKGNIIWGFLYKGYLFRMFSKSDCAMLIDTGKVDYYFNGFACLPSLKIRGQNNYIHGDTTELTVTLIEGATTCYLSIAADTSAKLYQMPVSSLAKKDLKDMKNDFPALEDLYGCFNFKQGDIRLIPINIRECVKTYNNAQSPLQKNKHIRQTIIDAHYWH